MVRPSQAAARDEKEKQVFLLSSARLALTFSLLCSVQVRRRLGSAQINLALRSPCTNFDFAQVRLRLGMKKKNKFSFCPPLALH